MTGKECLDAIYNDAMSIVDQSRIIGIIIAHDLYIEVCKYKPEVERFREFMGIPVCQDKTLSPKTDTYKIIWLDCGASG